HCVIVTEDECLKGKCEYPRGRCLSWLQINSEIARRTCRERLNADNKNTQGCGRMFLEFDINNLLPGTTSGDVCFHLLLDINTANITHIGFDCKLILANIVQVDIDFLKNRIHNRLTTSPILAAIVQIIDNDNHDDSSEHPMLNTILTLRNSGYCSANGSIDSGIVDRELEENEHNARILQQRRMKSKLRILHKSQSDNSILNPIRLQLTGNTV
uniref:MAM domain-containing protein n=1 Tax=Loa loa TaxID=7209 RepID=A0A1I7VAT7_LOALO